MSAPSHALEQPRATRTAFVLKQLFSLVGIVPIGVYAVVHMYNNSASHQGAAAYNAYLAESRSIPYYGALVIALIYLPILFHAVYGTVFLFRGRMNLASYPHFNNLKYVLQRISGLGLLAFIPAHVFMEKYKDSTPTDFARMAEAMHHPPTFWVYVLGILGVAYHLGNGVWDFCFGWGLVTGDKARKRLDYLCMGIFLVVLGLGYSAMYGFWKHGG